MTFQNLPKIELHLHLDCCLSFKVVQQLDPSIDFRTYEKDFKASPSCHSLSDYINIAARGAELMQTKAALRLVTLDLFEQLKKDQVIYAEIRFAPLLHLKKGLHPAEVVEAVNAAVTEGIAQTGIEARVILCTLRHYSETESMTTVQLLEEFQGTNIVGFDIAADEAGFPITNHQKAFNFAKSKGFFITAHAGEACGAASVWETVQQLYPTRIGHGVRSIEDPQLLNFLKEKDIHLEVCPTSNIITGAAPNFEQHPANHLYQKGISMSINTDGRTVSNTSLQQEYNVLNHYFNWQKNHFLHCNLEAIRHAFVDEDIKKRLSEKILASY